MFGRVTRPLRTFRGRYMSRSAQFDDKASVGKWNLVSSVCLQRKPVVAKEMTEMEKKMYNLFSKMEMEGSLKSDWEIQSEKDVRIVEEIKAGDSDKVGMKLRRDYEEEWKQEFEAVKLASRTTKDDKTKNMKSTDRCLDSSLFLVVKSEENGNRWIFPQGSHVQNETLRQTAERVLLELCGSELKVCFYGNAPCGFFKYKYPKSVRDELGVEGDKVFFFKASILSGQLKLDSQVSDFQWVDKTDLMTTLSGEYSKSVEMFLY